MKIVFKIEIEEEFETPSAQQWEEVVQLAENLAIAFKDKLGAMTEAKLDFWGTKHHE